MDNGARVVRNAHLFQGLPLTNRNLTQSPGLNVSKLQKKEAGILFKIGTTIFISILITNRAVVLIFFSLGEKQDGETNN